MALDPVRTLIARWPQGRAEDAALLKQCGVEAVMEEDAAAIRPALDGAGIAVCPKTAIAHVVSEGLWPGIRGDPKPRDRDETSSASREPWVDANGYQVYFERAVHPERPAVLGYLANKDAGLEESRIVPFETLELAYAEARLAGGNYLLSFDPRYRDALRAGDAKAKAAAESLARTARWLKSVEALLGRPVLPAVSMLVEPGDTVELANLAYRRGASPFLVSPARLPKPAPDRILVLSAVNFEKVPPAVYDHARAGSIVVIDTKPDPAWKLLKKENDRSFYALGRGQVVVYHDRIADPSEFGLDLNDLVTYKRRPVRIWNALAAIAVATEAPRPGDALMHVINYGSKVETEVQARIQGHYSKALLLRPEAASPQDLRINKRGTTSEVFLPNLSRLAIVHFQR